MVTKPALVFQNTACVVDAGLVVVIVKIRAAEPLVLLTWTVTGTPGER